VRQLQDRYENPLDKKGKARSHVADLKYDTVVYLDGERQTGSKAEKIALKKSGGDDGAV